MADSGGQTPEAFFKAMSRELTVPYHASLSVRLAIATTCGGRQRGHEQGEADAQSERSVDGVLPSVRCTDLQAGLARPMRTADAGTKQQILPALTACAMKSVEAHRGSRGF